MSTAHAAVWIDHNEARIFHFQPLQAGERNAQVDETTVPAPHHHVHRHGLSRGGEAAAHPEDSKHFFGQVATNLHGAEAVLILGPGSAKGELQKYLQEHQRQLAERIVGVESVDHPTDPQIVALARKVFARTDRLGR